jgi:hypothetical protein
MNRLEYIWWCFVVAMIFSGTWGALLFWFNEALGLVVGASFFVLAFLALINMDNEKEEQPQQNRRFNDV